MVVVVSSSVSVTASEAHSLHSLFDILNSIMVITSSLMIPVLLLLLLVMIVAAAVIVVRLSLLRVSSGGGPGTSVVHLLRSP